MIDNNNKNGILDDSLPVYAITGASGRLGRAALTCLLNQAPAKQILVTTRQPELLAAFAAKGVTVRYADFNDPSSLPAAFSGATRLFIIHPMHMGYMQHRAVIAAAVKARVRHITNNLSFSPNRMNEGDQDPWQRDLRQTIETFAESGGVWTTLNMNALMVGVSYFLNALRIGDQLLVPEGSGKPCWVTHEDYARTAVAVLTGKALFNGEVNVTGPESLGLADLAQRWSDLQRRKLEAQILPGKEVIERLVANGRSFETAQRIVGRCEMLKWFQVPVTDTVERATGTPATSVDGVLRDLVFADLWDLP